MKLYTLLLLGIFLISMSSATGDIGLAKQNECIDLYNYCPTCSYINLTAIQYPNGTLNTMNEDMTKSGNNYEYEFCDTVLIGDYSYTTCGDKDGTETCEDISFEVTPNGKEFKSTNSIAYLGFILIVLFTFFLTIYGAGKIEWKNKKNNEGKILTINNFRYVKILLYVLSYFELMFLFGLSYKTFNEAGIDGFTQFFNFIYQLFLNLIYPLMIFLIIFIFVTWINNKKLHQRLKLGLGK